MLNKHFEKIELLANRNADIVLKSAEVYYIIFN